MDNNFPLVSIIVPNFNQAQYLPIALDSVMFQDYPNLEIIICNYGSTDNSSDVIRRYIEAIDDEVSYLAKFYKEGNEDKFVRQFEKKFPFGRRIVVKEDTKNIGGTASYNEGFKAATGKYCTYLVADDYISPSALISMVGFLEETGVDFVYADMYVVDDHGRILQRLKKPEYSFEKCFMDWFHLGVCRLYKRSLHEKFGYFDTTYRNANDYDMYLRFAMGGCTFKHLPKVLYYTRKHEADNPKEPASWRNNGYRNLLRESVTCAERARQFIFDEGYAANE